MVTLLKVIFIILGFMLLVLFGALIIPVILDCIITIKQQYKELKGLNKNK